MLRATATVLLCLTSACSSPGADGIDAATADAPAPGDGGSSDRDSGSAGVGLVFKFVAAPAVGAVLSGRFPVTVDEAQIWFRNVRATGDSAPGDDRTTVADFYRRYRPNEDPSPDLSFPSAPPGHYSQLAARLGQTSGGESLEIRGTVAIDGTSVELQIRDQGTATADVVVPLDVAVEDQPAVVTIALDLGFLATQIDWSTAPRDNDKINLDESSPITAAVRAALADAFSAR